MRLCEHPEFKAAIQGATEFFQPRNLRWAIVEKDYYVTEALRIIASHAGDKVIFKGGTSLSKGWNLINRFSEDIDIFLDPTAFEPALGRKAIDRELKALKFAIDSHPGLSFVAAESQTIGGMGRNDRFEYEQRFGAKGEVPNRVLVEAGTSSGREPTESVALQSYVGEFLRATGVSLGAIDEDPFAMRLLHFRRTFVEKLFAIHAKVEAYKRDGKPIGGYARHYYDLYCLSQRPEVVSMLQSEEFGAIKEDYDRVSSTHFARDYIPPSDLSFCTSSHADTPDAAGLRG